MRGLSNENRQHCSRESLVKSLSHAVTAWTTGLHLPRSAYFLFRAASQKAAACLRGQRGLTLIEVLVAVAILGFIGTGLLTALNTQSGSARMLDEQVVAANLATAHLEAIKESPYADTYPNAGDNITIPFQYSVTIPTEGSNDGTTWLDPCAGHTLQKITVIVSREGKPVFSMCSYRCKR